jgi:hypothetical protein
MKSFVIAGAIAVLPPAALVTGPSPAQAQTPPAQAQPAPAPQRDTAQPSPITLAGCLYREDQVPGRKPNVAEQAGVLEDYIIAGASNTSTKKAPASGNMYKVEGPSDEQLKALVGKRVEVTGRIDPEGIGKTPGAPSPDRGPGPDTVNLPEFEASAIREASGTCPSTPAPRSS